MSITLTDRISVRVSAKNETESNDQKKRDGNNLANTYGGENLSDADAQEVGEALGETVTGEDGKTYARSDKVAGALKLVANKFKDRGGQITENGVTYGIRNPLYFTEMYTINGQVQHDSTNGDYQQQGRIIFSGKTVGVWYSATKKPSLIFSTSPFTNFSYTNYGGASYVGSAENDDVSDTRTVTVNGKTYTFYLIDGSPRSESGGELSKAISKIAAAWTDEETNLPTPGTTITEFMSIDDDHNKDIAAALFGSFPSKIDTNDKTDDQIKREIEEAAAANNAVAHFSSNPTDTYVAVTDENGNAMYFLGT